MRKLLRIPCASTLHVISVTQLNEILQTDEICQIRFKSHSPPHRIYWIRIIFFKKDEKDQILTSNVWLNLVSKHSFFYDIRGLKILINQLSAS